MPLVPKCQSSCCSKLEPAPPEPKRCCSTEPTNNHIQRQEHNNKFITSAESDMKCQCAPDCPCCDNQFGCQGPNPNGALDLRQDRSISPANSVQSLESSRPVARREDHQQQYINVEVPVEREMVPFNQVQQKPGKISSEL